MATDQPEQPGTVSRRTVLKLMGGTGVAVGLGPWPGPVGAATAAHHERLRALSDVSPSLQVYAYRRDDLLDLRFDLYNLKLSTTGAPALVRAASKTPAYVVVVFPFQQVGDEVAQDPPAPPWPTTPMDALASGPTQLAFLVPTSVPSIPFTLDALLDWTILQPQLVPVAVPTSGANPTAPTALQTFIEAPWQLLLSPDPKGAWHHSATPVAHGAWTELWQTRLGLGPAEPPAGRPLVRAVWTPGWPANVADPPFPMSLTGADRRDLVTLTSGRNVAGIPPVTGSPIPADLFMLTPIGASLDLHGSWNEPSVSSLIEWHHRMTTGRDSYVRVVRAGYLYPFGHRAVMITISDRELQTDPRLGDTVAYLAQRTFVVVTQLSKTYEGASPEPFAGRGNPLRTLTVKTVSSPPLDPVADDPGEAIPGVSSSLAVWVRSQGVDVPFHFRGLDWEGRDVDFSTGVIWVDETVANDQTTIGHLGAEYSSTANLARRTPDLGGQLVAFADVHGAQPGSTAQHADALEFSAMAVASPPPLAPSWYPQVASADVRLPAAEQVVGAGAAGLPVPTVAFPKQFLTNGFQPGVPEVFLTVVQSAPGLTFPANLAGGMATPNFSVDGLARDLGPVGDAAGLLGGTFDPATFFAGLEAKILGAISLPDIISAVTGAAISGKAPKIKSTPVYPKNDPTKPPTELVTTVDWTPDVQADPAGFFSPKGSTSKTLTIHVKVVTPVADPSKTTYDIDGQLVDFDLNLFGSAALFITVHFEKVHFTAKTGAKATVDVKVTTVTFAGPLTFINEFEQFFASLGGPSIDLEPTGVTAGYSLPLPSVGVGVFALENISLGAKLTIPFDGTPVRLDVDFCTRDNPFILSISLFAGGGFFGIALGADGIELIEVSLEFGAAIAMDLGVASGGVSIMAGIYFSLATNPSNPPGGDIVTLTGFLQASGNLEVLGIISISIVFYLGFTYLDPGKCYGKAEVTVTVKVLFFSASVDLTVEKRFGGSGDPTFAQAISRSDWDTYCAAFA